MEHRKHGFSVVAFVSVAAGTCLPSHSPEITAAITTKNTAVQFLRALPINCRCLQNHRLATGLYAAM
jgi:hypothetical protein